MTTETRTKKYIRFIPTTPENLDKLDCLIYYIETKHTGKWVYEIMNTDIFQMNFTNGGKAKLIFPSHSQWKSHLLLLTDEKTKELIYGIIK